MSVVPVAANWMNMVIYLEAVIEQGRRCIWAEAMIEWTENYTKKKGFIECTEVYGGQNGARLKMILEAMIMLTWRQ